MQWVFAEDQQLSRGVQGTLVVSGCSRPELNGRYDAQRKAYGRRPIFRCAENDRVLFYDEKRRLSF